MKKIIEEIVKKFKNEQIEVHHMLQMIDDAFIKKELERTVIIEERDECYIVEIRWKENNQNLNYTIAV